MTAIDDKGDAADSARVRDPALVSAAMGELVGTFILVFFGTWAYSWFLSGICF